MDDEFSVLKFCYDRKRRHPAPYSVAVRLLAIPVSCSASDRFFGVETESI